MKKFILFLFILLLTSGGTIWSQEPSATTEQVTIAPVVNRDYLPRLLDMINESNENIEFIHLEFHYDQEVKKVQNALREATARGVKVRGLIEDDISFNRTSKKYLNQYGIETKLDTPVKMLHNKLFIVDGQKILMGSSNLSSNSMSNNNETNLYVENPQAGAFFRDYFEQLWEDSNREPRSVTLRLDGLETVINRQHFPVINDLISQAKSRVWVIMYGMKYSESYPDSKPNRLIDELIAAAGRGIDVRVVLDKSDYNDGLNRINRETKDRLEKGGVKVHFDREEITTHAKLVISDNRLIIGSANWGYQAMDIRNESSLLTNNREALDFFVGYFLDIWENGTYLPEKPAIDKLPASPAPKVPVKLEKNNAPGNKE